MIRFFRYFANLRFAILLLLLIAFFSALGSIIEQDKVLDFYKANYTLTFFGIPLWIFFKVLSLNHIYSAWWFFFLLLLFGVCLLSCTFFQQFPALRFARRYYFYTYSSQFNKLNYKIVGKRVLQSQLCYRLIKEHYAIFQKQNCFYGYKGLIGRVGPVIVHFSIICILLGSIFGAVKGFTAQEFVPKTEIFHIQNIVKSGNLANIPQQAFRVNDFWVNYNKTGIIKQFQTDISVLTGKGDEILRKTISVNNPLIFKNLTLYQTDWGITGIRIKFFKNESIIQLPVSRISDSTQKLWITWIPISIKENTGIILILNNVRGKVELYNQKAQQLNNASLGQEIYIQDFLSLKLVEFISSSGIQIKSDPGIIIIYFGFGFLIISSFVSYVSFSEFWFLENNSKVFFGGRTNRDQYKLQIELSKLKHVFTNLQD